MHNRSKTTENLIATRFSWFWTHSRTSTGLRYGVFP